MKCSELSEEVIFAAVRLAKYPILGQNRWEIYKAFPGVPEKVVQAKLRNMVARKKLNGCACGCRGDFLIPSSK